MNVSSERRSPFRIAVGGLHTECSTYNPVAMHARDFRVLRGGALLAHPEFAVLSHYPDASFLPLLHARAIAGGPIAADTYQAFKAEFLARLHEAMPLDGVYLAMHGAAFVAGMEDAEGDWIAATRAVVGDAVPIAASYDLHGNVSARVIDALNMFSAYRTAPHIDVAATKRRACDMLLRCLRSGEQPHLRWVRVPVLLPGERTSTVDEPAASLYAAIADAEAADGVADVSVMIGYVWADEPRATACVIATGTDPAAMERAAVPLAQRFWDVREEFAFGMRAGSIAQCLDWAEQAASAPVVLADSGDNPTGGGVGDRADVLEALIERRASDTLLAGIADAPATEACYARGVGPRLRLRIGATLDPSGVAVTADAEVAFLLDAEAAERQAVVRIGGITLVLTARRRPFHTLADFACLGLDPRQVKLLVVKSGYLSPELAPIASPGLLALSAGVVDQDVARLPVRRVPRPTFPFDRDFAWQPRVAVSARYGAHAWSR
ncbi:MAG: M81 family metallopeptidase [Acetobacteraceae bacterium]|nr:M81 family metallopeptidase [Acetobacteraceae bacterium]